ncbi:MAG: quinolinate synthase NadA [Syntrophomonadaceae bacterium]|jgi:quinolinate synthase|nr:quinolinate synthase NadA [Syntrophomonadaceae bacterium]
MKKNKGIIDQIKKIKQEKSIYIIAHYYQRAEIQDIADFVGDSYAMAVSAKNSAADTILVAGVDFMAESAAILCPEKTVLIPEPNASCPMADKVDINDILRFKEENPEGLVVSYVNTPAAVKAVSDICVTSSNAVKIIEQLPKDARILFVPDENLGHYVAKKLNRSMDFYASSCPTHETVTRDDIMQLKEQYPEAEVLVHPECEPGVVALADYVGSTSGIIDYAASSDKDQLIIGTENGILHRIRQLVPDKELILAHRELICPNMKSITLNKILHSLETNETIVTVPEDIRTKAEVALKKMIDYAS